MFGAIEFFFEENRFIATASVFGAGLNVLLNYIFIPIFGFVAAAYTTLLCYICFSLAHYVFMRRVLKKHGIKDQVFNAMAILAVSLVVVVISFGLLMLYDYFYVRWALVFAIMTIAIIKRKELSDVIVTIKKKNE